MLVIICLALLSMSNTCLAAAAGLVTPKLSDPLAGPRYFTFDRLVTSGGVRFEGGGGVSLEPLLGIGHAARERELAGGYEESIHKLHAEAGGRLNLSKHYYLSAAAKMPVYTYGASIVQQTRPSFLQTETTRHGYDFLQMQGRNLTWTGEIGIHLGRSTDLNIFYDQSLFNSFSAGSRPNESEERFGTRIIFRFK